MSELSTTHRRFKLINGVHEHTDPVTKAKTQLVAGDPNRDTVVSNRNLAAMLRNKFLDLGPASDAEVAASTTAIPHTIEPSTPSDIPDGRDCTAEFIGTVDKGLTVFERPGAIKRGGGFFVFAFDETDGFKVLNEGGVGLSTGKAQDLIGSYSAGK